MALVDTIGSSDKTSAASDWIRHGLDTPTTVVLLGETEQLRVDLTTSLVDRYRMKPMISSFYNPTTVKGRKELPFEFFGALRDRPGLSVVSCRLRLEGLAGGRPVYETKSLSACLPAASLLVLAIHAETFCFDHCLNLLRLAVVNGVRAAQFAVYGASKNTSPARTLAATLSKLVRCTDIAPSDVDIAFVGGGSATEMESVVSRVGDAAYSLPHNRRAGVLRLSVLHAEQLLPIGTKGAATVLASVLSGTVAVGCDVMISPNGVTGRVARVEMHSTEVPFAVTGAIVRVVLSHLTCPVGRLLQHDSAGLRLLPLGALVCGEPPKAAVQLKERRRSVQEEFQEAMPATTVAYDDDPLVSTMKTTMALTVAAEMIPKNAPVGSFVCRTICRAGPGAASGSERAGPPTARPSRSASPSPQPSTSRTTASKASGSVVPREKEVVDMRALKQGDYVSFMGHGVAFPAIVVSIANRRDKKSGKILVQKPDFLCFGEAGDVKFEPLDPVPIDRFLISQATSRLAGVVRKASAQPRATPAAAWTDAEFATVMGVISTVERVSTEVVEDRWEELCAGTLLDGSEVSWMEAFRASRAEEGMGGTGGLGDTTDPHGGTGRMPTEFKFEGVTTTATGKLRYSIQLPRPVTVQAAVSSAESSQDLYDIFAAMTVNIMTESKHQAFSDLLDLAEDELVDIVTRHTRDLSGIWTEEVASMFGRLLQQRRKQFKPVL